MEKNIPIRELYSLYLEQYNEDLNDVEKVIEEKANNIEKMMLDKKVEEDEEFQKNFLLLSSFINMSNMYRRMGEKLIDEYFNKL